ncbi:hypothetical protein MKX01_010845 [Papaver californicum]|nr:hypothetical protein MKX01_010845 [Papaver californicum]
MGETYDFDNDYDFDKKVNILREVLESEDLEDVKTEVTALRLSYNMTSLDYVGAVFSSVLKLALQTPHGTKGELLRSVVSVITTWRHLLWHYIDSIDKQIESITKFEKMCLDSARDFAPMFEFFLHELEKDVLNEEAILLWA